MFKYLIKRVIDIILSLARLTSWAQINGRDELEMATKERYDGEYTRVLNEGGLKAFAFDCRCFFGTIISVQQRRRCRGGTIMYLPLHWKMLYTGYIFE